MKVCLLLAATSLAVLLSAVPLRADTLFSNIGEPGAATYQQDKYNVVSGFSDTFFYSVNVLFMVNRDSSGPVDLFLPIFAWSTGSAPNGLDSNNYPAFVLSLTYGAADEIWRSGPLFPSWLLNNGYDSTHACCSLFHVQTGDVQLHTGGPYVLTAIPWQTNTTDFWYLNDQGQPGLIVEAPVTTPEPETITLVALGLIVLLGRKRGFVKVTLD